MSTAAEEAGLETLSPSSTMSPTNELGCSSSGVFDVSVVASDNALIRRTSVSSPSAFVLSASSPNDLVHSIPVPNSFVHSPSAASPDAVVDTSQLDLEMRNRSAEATIAALQATLKEKTQHVDQLLKERDLGKLRMCKSETCISNDAGVVLILQSD